MHAALNQMTPAEGLAGFEDRIDELSRKMDGFGGSSPDPEMLRYLEAAINELRELSAGVASAEGVASIAGDVQALGARIDHLAVVSGASGLDSLAQRVNELTHALDTRVEQIGPLPSNIETLIKSLNDKLDGSDSGPQDQTAFAQIERRIMGLADKIEAADQRFGELGAIERGIQHLTHQVREAREEAVSTAERVARTLVADLPQAGGDISAFRRDLEALHAHQAESDQRTQDTLEAVHETLERLVERLASVETGFNAQPPAAAPAPAPKLPEIAEAPRGQPPRGARSASAGAAAASRHSAAATSGARETGAVHARAAHRTAADRPRSSRRHAARAGHRECARAHAGRAHRGIRSRTRTRARNLEARRRGCRQGELHRGRTARRAGRRQ